MLELKIKTFNELTTQELYNLLQLRSEVFVVEQDCVYQDLDSKDEKAIHVLGIKNDRIFLFTHYGSRWCRKKFSKINEFL